MHNKRRFIVFAIFVICLFFLMTFAGGSGNSTPATRTVEFIDGFDNSTISVQKIEVGEDAKVPENPKHENNVFAGWFLFNDHDKQVTDFKDITKNLKVIALYAADLNNNGIADENDEYFTVRFIDSLDNRLISEQRILVGLDAAAPRVPAHESYVFAGWSRGYTNIRANITVNALYRNADNEENVYEVTFIDGDTEEVIDIQNIEEGNAATLPEPPEHEGRVFDSWNGEYENITADTTITAIYTDDKNNDKIADETQPHYTVTYKDYDNTDIEVFEDVLVDLETPTIEEPTREYYEFTGWTPEVAETVTDNATYTATYVPNNDADNDGIADEEEEKYTVIYKLDETAQEAYAEYVNQVAGIATPVPENPDKEYAVFGGWDPEVAETVTKNATYIATWLEDKDNDNIADKDEAKFTVTYKLERTDEKAYAEYVNQVAGIATPKPADPDKEYAVFGGWDPEVAETVTAKATYIATWLEDKDNDNIADEAEEKYTVIYKLDETAEEAYAEYVNQVAGIATPVPENPDKEYAVFEGWEPQIAATVTKDAIYTAKWLEDKNNDNIADKEQVLYVVRFFGIDGTTQIGDAQYVLAGASAVAPVAPAVAGYRFDGWAQDFSNITANLDVYAKYTDIEAPVINATYELYNLKDGGYTTAGIYATVTDNIAVAEVKYLKGQYTSDKYNDATKISFNEAKNRYEIEGLKENAIYTVFAKDTAGNISTTQVVVEGITFEEAGSFEDLYATGTFGSISGFPFFGTYYRTLTVNTKSSNIKIVDARVNVGDAYKTTTDFENDATLGTKISFSDSSLKYTVETSVFARVSIYVKYEETIEVSPGVYNKVQTSKVYTTFMSYLWG